MGREGRLADGGLAPFQEKCVADFWSEPGTHRQRTAERFRELGNRSTANRPCISRRVGDIETMITTPERIGLTRPQDNRRRISFAAILALSFSALIILAVGGVLTVSVGANYRNTVDLIGARSSLLIDAMEDALQDHMSNAESAVDGVARIYAEGGFDIDDADKMTAVLKGALASVPEATGLFIYTHDLVQRGVVRVAKEGKGIVIESLDRDVETSPEVIAAIKQRMAVPGRNWGPIITSQFGVFANVSTPLIRDGVNKGFVVAPLEMTSVSVFTEDLSKRFGTHAFIIDGQDKVLAHELLADPKATERGIRPLAPLATFGDPVLAAYDTRQPVGDEPLPNLEVGEIRVDLPSGPRSYVAMTRKIAGYSDEPWTIGAYFERQELDQELRRAAVSALIGLGALAAALVAAIMLGKRLSRPVQAIAGHARRVADFDLDDLEPLPRSRVRELDDQASAFNAMLIGLRAFSTYIPRSLVAKLVRSGEGIAEPREAVVTVMFTDIVAFTTLSEHMDAAETTRLLNAHFEVLCKAVDAYDGTVDKFLGDGMMAFFGAPDHLEEHAIAAVSAAVQMRREIEADHARAQAENRTAFRVRIGIHTGPVTVGNIGAPDRVNYTIIGDTVNVSQRLQGLGKTLAPDADAAIIVSSETASLLDERFEKLPAGFHSLRGRGEAMEVFLIGAVDLPATSQLPQESVDAA